MTSTPDDPDARARAARTRFFALGLYRLSGALILIFGLVIAQEHFAWVQPGRKARILGVIVMTVGFIQMVLVPRLLARAWSSAREKA